jgi:glycylpeptide N-tetradecanoyltransferase
MSEQDHPSDAEVDSARKDVECAIGGIEANQSPTLQKKKKKSKKSKAMKALSALSGKEEIPQDLVNQVLDKAKAGHAGGAAGIDEEAVRMTLEQMRVLDTLTGKVGIGGKNKKDVGEHKVCSTHRKFDLFTLSC